MCWPIFWRASLNSSIWRCKALVSEPLAAVLSDSSLVLTSPFRSSGMRSSLSLMTFSAWWIMWSAWLRSSTSSRFARSSAEWASASLTIRSTSSLFRVEDAVIVTDCSRPVPLSCALTLRMPFPSRSNVTSTCGMPRGAGGMPSRWNRPSVRLSRAISRSPCRTWTSTDVWLSAAVEKTCERDVGIRLLRQARVLARRQEWSARSLGQVRGQRLELGACERHLEVRWTGLFGRDERQVDGRLEPARELDLGPLGSLGQALQSLAVGLQVDAVLLLELVGEPVHDAAGVNVTAAGGGAVGGPCLRHARAPAH